MKKHRWIFSILFLILLISIYYFFLDIYNRSIKTKEQAISVDCIDNNINIYKNSQGIIHIVSQTDKDLFFGLGYIHAKQHLWQICINRRIIKGTVAEIFGKEYLKSDYYMRIIAIDKISKELYKNSDEETKIILKKYTDGINTYIEQNKGKYSIEFNTLHYTPEKWTPEDCFAIQRYWAFLLSPGFTTDIALSEICLKIGFNKTQELIPDYSANFPFIIDNSSNILENSQILLNKNLKKKKTTRKSRLASIELSNILYEINNTYKKLNKISSNLGSNSWVINKPKNNRIKAHAILANDFHFPANAPSVFMQIHITSPGYNVTGITMPGMPIFLCGRNNHISWGTTSMRLDDVDFFTEKLNNKQDHYFINEKELRPIKEYLDTIRIKNKPEKVFYIRKTNTSRILSDIQQFSNNNSKKTLYKNNIITFRWTGTELSNELNIGLKIMQVSSWKQFSNIVKNWKVPGVVFSFADKAGNIGMIPAGIIPKRGITATPNFISDIWINTNKWQGFYKYNFNSIYNPKNKYIISANNAVQNNLPYHLSSYWAIPERAQRIKEILSGGEFYTFREAQYMQNDILSIYAKEQINTILYILLKNINLFNKEEKKAYYKLKKWDFVMSTKSTTSTIYNKFLDNLLYNVFADELGSYFYKRYLETGEMPLRKLNEVLKDTNSVWLNNINTNLSETLETIVINSFKKTLKDLTKIFNSSDSDTWHYSKMRTLTIKSPYFKRNKIEKRINNISKIGTTFIIGGNSTTINVSESNSNNFSEIRTIPVMRFIADMSDTVVYSVLAGGNSGDLISPNYSDQVNLWKIGAYLKISITPNVDNSFLPYVKFIKK